MNSGLHNSSRHVIFIKSLCLLQVLIMDQSLYMKYNLMMHYKILDKINTQIWLCMFCKDITKVENMVKIKPIQLQLYISIAMIFKVKIITTSSLVHKMVLGLTGHLKNQLFDELNRSKINFSNYFRTIFLLTLQFYLLKIWLI